MKKNVAVVMVMAAMWALAIPAFAQYSGAIHVSAPFSFMVENHRLDAGDYVVEKIAAGRLRIHTSDGRVSTTFLALPIQGKGTWTEAHFIFRRYGNEYFLAQIWTPGLEVGWEALEGKYETELAKNRKKSEPVETAVLIGR